jgi:ArsR family transcriptional regulator, arsenate/arsenite/antimonite-responsive transcriptional repressor
MFPRRIDVCQYGPRMAAAQPIHPPALGKVALPVLDCTPLFSGAPLDEAAAVRLAAMLKVLGEPARLRLLSLIQAQPDHEACVCHLTDALDLSQPTISHHLRVLFEAGLVDRERRGNWVCYRSVPGALAGVLEALGGGAAATADGSTSCANDCRCS